MNDKLSPVPRIVSAPDCEDAASIVSEFAPEPFNGTHMRVQHMGDMGTPELESQVANPVTWHVGQFTGCFPPAVSYVNAQRGYRDFAPPRASSAFQLWCNGAGFYIDTRTFNHAGPLYREGPSVSVACTLVPERGPVMCIPN